MEAKMLTVRDVANIIQDRIGKAISLNTVRNWIREKKLLSRKLGGMRLVCPSSVEKFLSVLDGFGCQPTKEPQS
jgi:hypothetical protein